jgi:Ca2+-binding RTX toxin-like protein
VLDGGAGADTMNAGDGSDTYFVDNTGDVVAESFNDALGGVDTVNSSVSFGPLGFGIENLNLTGLANINGAGNANNNVINGNAGINTLDGADGNDKLNGNAGNDVLNGGNGNDALNGGAGVDTMTGGLGNDIYFVNAATDAVIEAAGVGTGVDLVNSTINYTLGLNLENLTLLGAANLNGNGNTVNNVIRGNGGANILNGNAGHDKLFGNAGNDTLNGGTGSDTIDGGDGNDLIVGGAGQDNMTGGLGADTFDFNSVAESPTLGAFDTITNFTWSEGDKIDLVTIDADVTLAGNQAFGLAQLSFNSVTSLFTADVIGGADLSINLVGVQSGFSVNLDVIA